MPNDPELAAMVKIARILDSLTDPQRDRVFAYIAQKEAERNK